MTAILRDVAALRAQVAAWRRAGESVALVPTMGALHAGHMELVMEARRRARRVILTVFVNPTQFAPGEDFALYPRDLAADLALFADTGGDAVYAPEGPVMYPDGFATTVSVRGPALAGLEDRFRPDHFAGVATVVAKLLIQAGPDLALFGEKDFQQLRVIHRMARDLDLPVEIVGVPVVRAGDGLALSSRNVYLSSEERERAPMLYRGLRTCAGEIARGASMEVSLDTARATLVAAGFVIDYLEARDGESLLPSRDGATTGRILVAARLGRTRLIDNVAISPNRETDR